MTPLTNFENIYLKREDLNPTGSAKDRALPLQIENLIKNNFSSAVISSTGNAAISASFYCQQANIPLTVFVSPNINRYKLSQIKANIVESLKPISDAIKFSKKNHSYLLRQSTDINAQIGYGEITKEILSELPQITSIFIPVGSGTTLLGIAKLLPNNVKIFAVQPASNPTICSIFRPDYTLENETITDALSVKYLPLKKEIIKTIKLHQGDGLIVRNQEVIKASEYTKHFLVSPESALCLAGYHQIKNNIDVGKFPVILFTGTKRQ
ncbi:MAG TPA: PLP-dependent lyase/thiolase [Candidatus Methanoperedens sp.]|nr:PLP-dependent lyase/thiolase [Candidatus Methanoperedens sp.]